MKKNQEGLGQISRFYQTELLSSEECGIFLTNIEIAEIAVSMNYEITLTSNEFILAELFKMASAENRLDELNNKLLVIFEDRLIEYNKVKKIFPKASKPISTWIEKCQKTINKIKVGGTHG